MEFIDIFNLLLLDVFLFVVNEVHGSANESEAPSNKIRKTVPVELDDKPEHGEGFIVALLDEGKQWVFTGSLVTWNKVLTTCTATLSEKVKFASFGADDKDHSWLREIHHSETDQRCLKTLVSNYLRYNVGVLGLEEPAVPSRTTRLLQYPSLSKQKYLRLTDQVINRRLKCTARFATEMGWEETIINMMPSHERKECEAFTGMHEFICSESTDMPIETIVVNQGTPVLCGEDTYGIIVAPDKFKPRTTTQSLIMMRLDEFVHLIVKEELNFDYYS